MAVVDRLTNGRPFYFPFPETFLDSYSGRGLCYYRESADSNLEAKVCVSRKGVMFVNENMSDGMPRGRGTPWGLPQGTSKNLIPLNDLEITFGKGKITKSCLLVV
ncbi:hypothetical protein P3S67_028291 [Capsicum chacoense]